MNDEKCVVCGAIIPEGLQVCPSCMESAGASNEQVDAARQFIDINNVIVMADSGKNENAIQSILNIAKRLGRSDFL